MKLGKPTTSYSDYRDLEDFKIFKFYPIIYYKLMDIYQTVAL
jgi:hypothetical protein